MKILLTTPSLRSEVGGPAFVVCAIEEHLRQAGCEATTITLRGQGGLPMASAIRNQVFENVDIVHNFGAWTLFAHQVSARARRTGLPLVFSPMGMFEPWALSQKRLKKQLGWKLYQYDDILRAAAVHATARSEAQHLRSLKVNVPIAIIPHGIDIPIPMPERLASGRNRDIKTVLFLSRIHPKKGLLDLVEAWDQLRPDDWRAVIAGPDEDGYRSDIEKVVRARQLRDSFTFVGPVYGKAKADLFTQANLFVLPTHSENFGLVIPEALAHGVPVITTTGAPWGELLKARCGWWVPIGVSGLTNALSEAFALPISELTMMGARGRDLVERQYAWPSVIEKHLALYNWILGAGQRPDFLID